MANDDLTIKIVVDDDGAKEKLREDDRALDNLGQTAKKTGAAVSDYEKQVKATVQAHQASTKAIDTHQQSLASLVQTLKLSENKLYDNTAAAAKLDQMFLVVGASGLALTAAIAAIAYGLYQLASAAAEVGDHLSDMADTFGGSVPAVSALSSAVTIAGGTMERVANATSIFQQRMVEGSEKFTEGMRRVNLSVDDLKAAAPDQQFLLVASAIRSIQDPAERSAAAMELFGRQGRELMPVLMKPLDELVDKAKELGLTWSEEDTKAAEQFEMASRTLHLQLSKMATDIGREVIPVFTWFIEHADDAAWIFKKGVEFVLPYGQALHIVGQEALYAKAALDLLMGRSNAPEIASPDSLAKRLQDIKDGAFDKARTPDALVDKQRASTQAYASSLALPLADEKGALRELASGYDLIQAAAKRAAAAAAEHAKNLEEYTNTSKSYAFVLDQIGNDMYEGIAFDIKRGVSTKALVDIWKTSATTIDNVRAVEAKWNDGLDAILKTMAENEAMTVKAADSVITLAQHYDEAGKLVKGVGDVIRHLAFEIDGTSTSQLRAVDINRLYAESLKKIEDGLRAVGENIMLAPNVVPSGMVPTALARVVDTTKEWNTALRDVSRTMSEIGRLVGGTAGDFIRGFGQVIQVVQQTQKSIADLNALKASGQISQGQNVAGQIASYAGLATAVYSFANAYIQGMIEEGKLRTLDSIALQLANSFASASRFSQALNAELVKLRENVINLPQDVLERLGVNNHGSGEEYRQTLMIVEEVYAEALKLPDIIKELGGLSALTAAQMATVLDRTQYLFRIIAEGGAAAGQATQTLDTVLADMGTTGAANGGVVSQFFLDMVVHARELGIELPKVTQFLKEQASVLATGLSDLLQQPLIESATAVGKAVTDAQKAIDDLTATGKASADELAKAQQTLTDALTVQHGEAERNQDALRNLGYEAVLAFEAAIASGSNFMQALQGISGQLGTLQQAYKDLGLAADDPAINGLLLLNTILNGTADKPSGLGKAIGGLQALFTAAQNIPGLMTPDAFHAQQGTLASLYAQTQASAAANGATGDQGTRLSLIPFQQTLHEMQDYAKKNNLALDDRTQMLIDQSKELGIWTDDFKSDSEKTRESIADLIKSNYDLIAALGSKADHDPAPTSGTTTGLTLPPGSPPPWSEGNGTDQSPFPMASGGSGFARGPMVFSTNGNEEFAFSGEGRRFSRGMNASSSPTIIVAPSFTLSSFDPKGLPELVEHEVMPIVIGLIKDRVRDFQPRMVDALRPGK